MRFLFYALVIIIVATAILPLLGYLLVIAVAALALWFSTWIFVQLGRKPKSADTTAARCPRCSEKISLETCPCCGGKIVPEANTGTEYILCPCCKAPLEVLHHYSVTKAGSGWGSNYNKYV